MKKNTTKISPKAATSSAKTKLSYATSTAYLRDAFVPFKDAQVNIASSPFLYGLTIYTVFNLIWNDKTNTLNAFRLKDHYKRLVLSAKVMDFNNFAKEWSYERFEAMVRELVAKNNITEDALVRVSVFVDALLAGTKIHDLPNAVCAYVYPMGEIVPRSGINVCVSSWRRNADNAIPSRAKVNGAYANVSLMKNEALLNGYDDAIALNDAGYVTEGTVANLFLVRGGELITPAGNFDILEGITRDTIIRIARNLGITVTERSISRSELYIADEAFISGSSARITPVLSIDRRVIGPVEVSAGTTAGKTPPNTGQIGPITKRLMSEYEALQKGIIGKYKSWLTKL